MDALVMAGQLILSLAILVTLHELGHFLAARAFGIKVEKFYLFFDAWGIKLFSFKRGGTEYGIGWLPLGGYVKIAGMIDESLDTEQMKKDPEPWEFRAKPAWQRLIVMIAGVTVNAILGIIIFTFLVFANGKDYMPVENMKYGIAALDLGEQVGFEDGDRIISVNGKNVVKYEDIVTPNNFVADRTTYVVERGGQQTEVVLPKSFIDKYADAKGDFIDIRFKFIVDKVGKNSDGNVPPLQKGDRIVSINDTAIEYFDEFKARVNNAKGKTVPAKVLRNNDTVSVKLTIDEAGTVGFIHKPDLEYKTEYFSFGQSIGEGYKMAIENLMINVRFFGKIFKGEANASKSLSGPIGIAEQFGSTWEWTRFWTLTGLLSVVLAFMNLLPIPALDGGHVLFLLIEMIIGRPLPEKFLHVMQVIGMIILLALMVFIFGNDIYKGWFK